MQIEAGWTAFRAPGPSIPRRTLSGSVGLDRSEQNFIHFGHASSDGSVITVPHHAEHQTYGLGAVAVLEVNEISTMGICPECIPTYRQQGDRPEEEEEGAP